MTKLLANFSLPQRISIAVAAVLAGVGIYALVHHQREADFQPLFTGLSTEDAAGILQKMKEAGVEYRLPEGGGSVLAPSAKLAELRLSMAAAGLPKTGRIGFELFDKANLGATEFTEHVNYRRALEGELERSITSLVEVEQARVHLTFAKESVFLESQQPAKASVMVKVRPGAKLAPQNVLAIEHLVSSAVEGLSPDAVSVVDMNGNLLGRPKAAASLNGPEPSEALLDFRHKIEADLLGKVNSTLEPLLGVNKFRAGVSVECDYSGGEQSEETFDPARSVMVSSQRTEDSSGSSTASGVPGTASSLPRPASRPGNGSKNVTRMTENVSYQTSRIVKKTHLPAGAVRKMSLAVLVDQELSWEKDKDGLKRVLTPPPAEKLKIIRDLVAGVTGFNQERGDQLVIETLPFETTLSLEPPQPPSALQPVAPAGPLGSLKGTRTILTIGGAVVAGLVLIIVLAMVLRGGKKTAPAVSGPAEIAAAADTPALPASTTLKPADKIEAKLAEQEALQQKLDEQALSALKLTPVTTKTAELLAKHLRDKVSKEPELAAQIVRTWIRQEQSLP
jgi:flagellar M-ring protein FliF